MPIVPLPIPDNEYAAVVEAYAVRFGYQAEIQDPAWQPTVPDPTWTPTVVDPNNPSATIPNPIPQSQIPNPVPPVMVPYPFGKEGFFIRSVLTTIADITAQHEVDLAQQQAIATAGQDVNTRMAAASMVAEAMLVQNPPPVVPQV